eukprot:4229522-Pleurochrysis_carterae.AAC.3
MPCGSGFVAVLKVKLTFLDNLRQSALKHFSQHRQTVAFIYAVISACHGSALLRLPPPLLLADGGDVLETSSWRLPAHAPDFRRLMLSPRDANSERLRKTHRYHGHGSLLSGPWQVNWSTISSPSNALQARKLIRYALLLVASCCSRRQAQVAHARPLRVDSHIKCDICAAELAIH